MTTLCLSFILIVTSYLIGGMFTIYDWYEPILAALMMVPVMMYSRRKSNVLAIALLTVLQIIPRLLVVPLIAKANPGLAPISIKVPMFVQFSGLINMMACSVYLAIVVFMANHRTKKIVNKCKNFKEIDTCRGIKLENNFVNMTWFLVECVTLSTVWLCNLQEYALQIILSLVLNFIISVCFQLFLAADTRQRKQVLLDEYKSNHNVQELVDMLYGTQGRVDLDEPKIE